MTLTQALLKGLVQLLWTELFTLFQIELHQLFIDFYNLIDDGGVHLLNGGECGRSIAMG